MNSELKSDDAMVVCPPIEILDQLLAGSLPDNDSQKLASHVEECIHCQTVLDNQTAWQGVIPGINCEANITVQEDAGWTPDRIKRFARILFDAQSTSLDNDHHSTNPDSIAEFALPEIPGYDVQKVIGQGGMGIVLKARHQRMQRDVAIKILPQSALEDESAINRFYRETQAIAALLHPNIVAAFDAGEQGDLHYLVMEYVDGWDLAEVVSLYDSLNVADAVECIIQAARGLHHAHKCNMTHRDIKPSNLILDRHGNVKVLDLGLARFTQILLKDSTTLPVGQLTNTWQFMGSVDYMAPEQVMDARSADYRSDIYSLGCTFYRILTGESLFTGDSLMQRIMAHREQNIPSLRLKRSDVPLSIENVYRKMVAKSPDTRQQSMTEVIDELQQAMADEQSISQPDLLAVVERLSLLDQYKDETVNVLSQPTLLITKSTSRDRRPIESSGHDPQSKTLIAESNTNATGATGNWRKMISALAMFGMIGVLATVFFLKTSEGTLRVEINDPSIKVQLKGTDIFFTQAKQKPITIKPGSKTLIITRDDFTFETNQFILNKGKTTVVKVDLLPGKVQIVSAGNVIGQHNLIEDSEGGGAKTTPTTDVITPADGWVDIEQFIDPAVDSNVDDNFTSAATHDRDQLVLGHRTSLSLPLMLNGSYQVRAELTTWNGPKYLHVSCPVAASLPVLVLGEGDNETGYSGAGLQTIDGRGASDPANPTHVKDHVLIPGQKQLLELSVASKGDQITVQATVDGKPMFDWTGPASSLPDIAEDAPRQITVSTYKGMLKFHTLKIKMLDGEAKLLRTEAFTKISHVKDTSPQAVTPLEPLTKDQQNFLNNLRLLPAELQLQEVVVKLQQINGIVGPPPVQRM